MAIGGSGDQRLNGQAASQGYVSVYNGSSGAGLIGAFNGVFFAPSGFQQSTNMFGYSLAWADTDGAGQLDLIVGSPAAVGNTLPPLRKGWVFRYYPVSGQAPVQWLQTNFPDPSANQDERFGWSVASATRIGTSLQDILVGASHANIPGTSNAGEAFAWNY